MNQRRVDCEKDIWCKSLKCSLHESKHASDPSNCGAHFQLRVKRVLDCDSDFLCCVNRGVKHVYYSGLGTVRLGMGIAQSVGIGSLQSLES